MKKFISYTTILSYSIFSFVFASVCPVVCMGFASTKACSIASNTACHGEGQGGCSHCPQSNRAGCTGENHASGCPIVKETPNSIGNLCICPLPEKMPSTAGIIRFVNDVVQIVQPQMIALPAGASKEQSGTAGMSGG